MDKDTQQTVPYALKELARLLGTHVKNRRLDIPEEFGKGYCAGFVFDEHIRMFIFNYELKEDLIIENPDIDVPMRMILFKFQNIFPETEGSSTSKQGKAAPSVLIATRRMNADVVIPIHTNTATINIEVDATYLNGLFDLSEKSPVLQGLLQNTQPLLFEQLMFPSLQKIVDEIVHEPVDEAFELFFQRVNRSSHNCYLLREMLQYVPPCYPARKL